MRLVTSCASKSACASAFQAKEEKAGEVGVEFLFFQWRADTSPPSPPLPPAPAHPPPPMPPMPPTRKLPTMLNPPLGKGVLGGDVPSSQCVHGSGRSSFGAAAARNQSKNRNTQKLFFVKNNPPSALSSLDASTLFTVLAAPGLLCFADVCLGKGGGRGSGPWGVSSSDRVNSPPLAPRRRSRSLRCGCCPRRELSSNAPQKRTSKSARLFCIGAEGPRTGRGAGPGADGERAPLLDRGECAKCLSSSIGSPRSLRRRAARARRARSDSVA